MDLPPHPLSNATHFLRYHPLRCIIIFIILAVCVADDMFEGFLLANWLQYFYHRMESERYPTTMCIRMVWLTVGYGRRGNRRLALRWGSWFFLMFVLYIIIISWGCMMYDGYTSPWFVSYTTTYVVYVYSGWRWYTASCNGCARMVSSTAVDDCSIDDDVRSMIRCVGFYIPRQRIRHRCLGLSL